MLEIQTTTIQTTDISFVHTSRWKFIGYYSRILDPHHHDIANLQWVANPLALLGVHLKTLVLCLSGSVNSKCLYNAGWNVYILVPIFFVSFQNLPPGQSVPPHHPPHPPPHQTQGSGKAKQVGGVHSTQPGSSHVIIPGLGEQLYQVSAQ